MTQLNPTQLRGLKEAYKKIEELEGKIQNIEENMLTKEEFAELMKGSVEAYKKALADHANKG